MVVCPRPLVPSQEADQSTDMTPFPALSDAVTTQTYHTQGTLFDTAETPPTQTLYQSSSAGNDTRPV
jgi:hypothetical protein